jgi:hypothetical protein
VFFGWVWPEMRNVARRWYCREMVSAVAGEVRENWRRRRKKKKKGKKETRCVREVRAKKKKI